MGFLLDAFGSHVALVADAGCLCRVWAIQRRLLNYAVGAALQPVLVFSRAMLTQFRQRVYLRCWGLPVHFGRPRSTFLASPMEPVSLSQTSSMKWGLAESMTCGIVTTTCRMRDEGLFRGLGLG